MLRRRAPADFGRGEHTILPEIWQVVVVLRNKHDAGQPHWSKQQCNCNRKHMVWAEVQVVERARTSSTKFLPRAAQYSGASTRSMSLLMDSSMVSIMLSNISVCSPMSVFCFMTTSSSPLSCAKQPESAQRN